jgi:hypothetical protein
VSASSLDSPAATKTIPTRSWDLRWHLVAVWCGLSALLLTATRTDPDLWGHAKFGLDFLATRRLPVVDPYSFTQDRPWINHEWLSEALTAAAFRAAGPAGIVLLKSLVVASVIAILLLRLRGATLVITALVATAALVSALPLTGTMRPQIWSLLCLAMLMIFLRPDGRPTVGRTVGLCGLFALWANLHGGWITGAAALGVYCAIRGLRNPRAGFWWIAVFVFSIAATLLNPYGATLWRFLAGTVRASRPDITEWQPFGLHEPAIMWVSALVPIVAIALVARRHPARIAFETWAVAVLLIVAGLRVSRVTPLVAPAVLVLLGPLIAREWGRLGRLPAVRPAALLVFSIPVLTALAAVWAPVAAAFRCLPIQDAWAPDRYAAAYLEGLHGRVWIAFDWGEYVIWHFGPALRVSIDGRRETVYSDDIIEWHRAFDLGAPWARARFLAAKPEYVWLRADRAATRDWLASNGYRIDAATALSFVGVRGDLPALKKPADVMPSCFP